MTDIGDVHLKEKPALLKVNIAGGNPTLKFYSEISESRNGPWMYHEEAVVNHYPSVEFRSWMNAARFIKVHVQDPKYLIEGDQVFLVGTDNITLNLSRASEVQIRVKANALPDLFLLLEDIQGNRYHSKKRITLDKEAVFRFLSLPSGRHQILGRYLGCAFERNFGEVEVGDPSAQGDNVIKMPLDMRSITGESYIESDLSSKLPARDVYLRCLSHTGEMQRTRVKSNKIIFGHWHEKFYDGVKIRIGKDRKTYVMQTVFDGAVLNELHATAK